MKLTIKIFVDAVKKKTHKKPPRLKRPVCSRVVGVLGPVVPVFWSVAPVGEPPLPQPLLSESDPRCSPQ